MPARGASQGSAQARKPKAGPVVDSDQLEDLQLQQRVAKALLGYGDTVSKALRAMEDAHQTLEDQGVCSLDEVAPAVRLLAEGIREARDTVQESIKKLAAPLETHIKLVNSALNEAAKAQALVSGTKRPSTPRKGWSPFVKCRQAEQQEEAETISLSTDVACLRAQDSCGAFERWRGALCQMANAALVGTSKALRCVAERAPPGAMEPAPEAGFNPFDCAEEGFNPFAEELAEGGGGGGSCNPFDEDDTPAHECKPAAAARKDAVAHKAVLSAAPAVATRHSVGIAAQRVLGPPAASPALPYDPSHIADGCIYNPGSKLQDNPIQAWVDGVAADLESSKAWLSRTVVRHMNL